MALSLKKLKNILVAKGMILKKIFHIGEFCVYIEIIHINSANIFLLYIPSKYEINISNHNNIHNI